MCRVVSGGRIDEELKNCVKCGVLFSTGNLEGFTPKLNLYNLNGLKFSGTSAASSEFDSSEPMDIETEVLVQSPQEDRGMDLDLRQFLEGGAGQ